MQNGVGSERKGERNRRKNVESDQKGKGGKKSSTIKLLDPPPKEMGEGVSLSLPRYGFPVGHSLEDAKVIADEDRSIFDLPSDVQCSEPQCLDPVRYDLSVRSSHSGASSGVRVSEDDISAGAIKNTSDQYVAGVDGNSTGQITFSGDLPSDLEAAAHVNDVAISATATMGSASVPYCSTTTTATHHVASFLRLGSGDFPPLPLKGVLGNKGASISLLNGQLQASVMAGDGYPLRGLDSTGDVPPKREVYSASEGANNRIDVAVAVTGYVAVDVDADVVAGFGTADVDAGSDDIADCSIAVSFVGAMSSDPNRVSCVPVIVLPISRVPDPDFSTLQTPATGSMGLNSAGSGVLDLDLRGSELRIPDPRDNSRSLDPHEGIKTLPSAMKSGVTKLLPAWGSSVYGIEPGSLDPIDGGIGSRFGSCMTSTLATGRLEDRVMQLEVKSCISKPLRLFGSSVNRLETEEHCSCGPKFGSRLVRHVVGADFSEVKG